MVLITTIKQETYAQLPLVEGQSIVTCGTGDVYTIKPSNPNDPVIGIKDVRSLPSASPAPFEPSAYMASDWLYGTVNDATGRTDKLGTVFGITYDKQKNIYTTHYSGWGVWATGGAAGAATVKASYPRPTDGFYPKGSDNPGKGGPGAIYKIDANTEAVTVLATLPQSASIPLFDPASSVACCGAGTPFTDPYGRSTVVWYYHQTNKTGPGLGNIDYDYIHNQLFVTNLEDGKIYRISTSGTILSNFDPMSADDGLAGYAPLGERIWGIGYNHIDNRVYYAVWNQEIGSTTQNTIRSVALNASGDFVAGSDKLEITVPFVNGYTARNGGNGTAWVADPITDIEFSSDGKMLMSGKSMIWDWVERAHSSRPLEYVKSGSSWTLNKEFFVGSFLTQTNAAGGVDYGYMNGMVNSANKEQMIWASSNVIRTSFDNVTPALPDFDIVYGAQGVPISSTVTEANKTEQGVMDGTWNFDYNGDYQLNNKGYIGDIDIYSDFPPVCALNTTAVPTTCAPATNQYNISGTVSLTAAVAGTLTISTGASATTIAVTAATTSVNYTLNGLVSDGQSHTVTASLPGCSTTTATYTAPASCTLAPVCSMSAVATPGLCATATNAYSATALVTLTNPTPGVLTVTNGAQSLTFATTAVSSATFTAVFNGLVSDGQSHTVTASLPGCSTTTATYTAPASCTLAPVCSMSAVATPGLCATATNAYSATAVVKLTNPTPGVLTVTNGAQSLTFATTAVSSATFTAVFNGLVSDGQSHTVTASLPGCSTTTATYTAPASCTIAPVCSITAVATPGLCATATNAYSATAVVKLTNPTPGVLTVTNGAQSLTFATTAVSSATFTAVFNGLVSDGQSHTVTASLPGCSTTTATYTAPASCTIAPVCSITAVATPGLCATATNAYSATAVVKLTNPTPGVLTVTNGAQSLTFATTAVSSATFTAVFNGLVSDGQSHTVTASLPGCSTTTATYTAPASCTIAPVCSITAVATPGLCATATNAYSATAVVTLANPTPGVLTVTNGAQSLTFATTAVSSATFTAVFNGLVSDGQSHTVTASLPGCSTTTTTYVAPASCTIAPVCSITAVATPGLCATATNAYSATAVVRLTNPTPGVLTVTNGTQSLTTTIASGLDSFSFTAVFNGLISDGQSHTVTASLPGCSTTTATYTAPVSCTIAPVCSMSAVATPGLCATATNAYSATALVTLTNLTPGVLTVTNGAQSLTFATTAVSSATFTAVFNGLVSDGQSHTVTASLPGCSTTTATYTAPASCTIAPVCSITAVATPGLCATATNAYSATAVVTLANPTPGVLTVTNGAQSLTFATTAVSSATFTAVFNGLVSDGQSHTVTASLPGCSTTTTTYVAPASCTIAPVCSITAVATPGLCATATNAYSATAVVRLTNPTPGVLTVTNGTQSLTTTIASGLDSFSFTAVFNGLISDGQSHTVTASLPGCSTTTTTYVAPASCTIAPVCSITAVATPGLCATATNAYSATAVVRLTNPTPGVLTVTNGTQSLTTTIASGLDSFSFTAVFNGLISDGQSHTVTASLPGCSTTTATYTAPVSCTIAPVCSMSAVATPGLCATATNAYSATALVTLTNLTPGVLTVTNGAQSLTFATTAVSSATFTAVFNGLVSDGQSHTVTASLPGCSTTTATYTAPESCTLAPPCSISALVTAGSCATATNAYSATAVVRLTNPTPGVLTVTNGAQSLTFATTAVSSATFTATFNGLTSDGQSHTVTASLPGCSTTTATYTAPTSCSLAPALALIITPGTCNTATNQYVVTGSISLTATSAGTLTISDGTSTTTVSVTANQPSVTFNLAGLPSGTGSHSLTVSYLGKISSVTYTAPLSCTITPPCLLNLVVAPDVCNTATNQYSVRGTISATNTIGSQLVTITDGIVSMTATLVGNEPTSFTLSGLTSSGTLHTLTASATNCGLTSTTYTAPASCSVAPTAGLGDFVWSDTNKNGIQDAGEAPIPNVVATLFINGVSSATTLTNATGFYSFTGLTPGSSLSYSVGFTAPNGYTATLANVGDDTKDSDADLITGKTQAITLTAGEFNPTLDAGFSGTNPELSLDKRVDKSKATLGEVLSYSLVLTNTGTTVATNVVVQDSTSAGLSYVLNSATAPVGTTFTQGTPISHWTIASLNPGQSLTLTVQAKADSSGILYNTATIPGDTAKVCTSIPVKMCLGDEYTLTAPVGRPSYRWFKDGILIQAQSSNELVVNEPGSYSLESDNTGGICPDFSCCPFILELDTLPDYQAVAVAATCQGNTPQNNGQVVLSQFNPKHTYQYSPGASFNPAASLSGPAQVIPANGVLASTLASPGVATAYTVRVYNQSGCYSDMTVLLMPTVCDCPAEVCLPYVIKQTKRPGRLGDQK
ncbi:DUF11 domain-containing protein [Spirosoma aureum]|uniref:DUF11 domain-containing protein n=1 Tax=Spirosoma aureum TaxID=2692134 RepID=A0A6G9ARV5_9BACT|nr:SdrD B-like domain-containing protein [Spirosoma aureum]QIP15074.1 DUF11 domain-containing protein [Spirosoma aureum]